ncbi:hypothetical protein Taro_019587, partial [Colocasia esculenta]|nr:hypothetical protein [Colocasia esculenta]
QELNVNLAVVKFLSWRQHRVLLTPVGGNPLAAKYKHFYAKDESTHPSMVSTHQHIFKGKLCKNVETVSTHVKSVSTRVEVFQKSSLPRSTHSQSRSTLDPVPRTASLQIWDSRSTHSQSRVPADTFGWT